MLIKFFLILQSNVKTKEINIGDKNLVWVHCIISKKIAKPEFAFLL